MLNPPARTTKKQKAAFGVALVIYWIKRHAEAVTLLLGILIGKFL